MELTMNNPSNISTAWTQNLSKEDKENFTNLLMNSYNNAILVKLREIVTKKRLNLEASERTPETYDVANWSHKQAHNNGARQMLKFVEDLLAFTNKPV